MKALRFERKPVKYAAAAVAGRLTPGRGATVGPLRLADVDPPEAPAEGWVRLLPRLAGICGSDLATIDGRSSRYFEPIVSFPFTPGHEVVGERDDGSRAVLVPVLTCTTRGIDPPCAMCRTGRINLCERIAFGHLEPGLQTGFCADTGGGWSTALVAHESQLVTVPDDLSDEAAVMVEPTACAVHAAALVARSGHDQSGDGSARRTDGGVTAVMGAGTLGLLTVAALRARPDPIGPLVVVAKHPVQRRLARELGADRVVGADELGRAVRATTGSFMVGDQLTGGAVCVVDCVGSDASLSQALSVVAPAGRIVLVGMPGPTSLDLTPLWHRETAIQGSYAYTPQDFAAAVDLVRSADLGRLVSATYPLARFTEAIEHAAAAGRRGAVKIAFDLREEKHR